MIVATSPRADPFSRLLGLCPLGFWPWGAVRKPTIALPEAWRAVVALFRPVPGSPQPLKMSVVRPGSRIPLARPSWPSPPGLCLWELIRKSWGALEAEAGAGGGGWGQGAHGEGEAVQKRRGRRTSEAVQCLLEDQEFFTPALVTDTPPLCQKLLCPC